MYGNITSKPTTSYFCYEFFIFVTALLLVFTGCGKDEGGGASATPVTTPQGSNWSVPSTVNPTSVADADSAEYSTPALDAEAKTWLQSNAPDVLSALLGLNSSTGTTDAAIQRSSNDLSLVMRLLPEIMQQARAEVQDQLIAIYQAIAKEVQKLAKERKRARIRAFLTLLSRMANEFINTAKGKGGKKKSKK